MRNFLFRAFGPVGLWLCCIPMACYGQATTPLLERTIDLQVRKGTLMLTLSLLADKNIPVGIEFSSTEKNEPKLDVDVKKAPLLEVLNLITQQEPNYVWEIRDGVINFTPVQNRDAFFEKLLSTSIRSFQSPKGNDKFVIKNALVDLPEIKQLLTTNGVDVDPFGYPHKPSIYANDTDLSDHDTTFRSLLNKIIRESEHNSWVLQWLDKKHKLIEIGL
jgi:hypothetical protein